MFTSPADSTFTTVYDADGDAVSETAPGGVAVSSDYDRVGNLTAQRGSGADAPTADRSFGYDLAGRLTSVSAPGGTDTFTRDDRGLLLAASGPSGSSSFSYTADGLLSTRADAAGTTSYHYDDNDRPDQVSDASTGIALTYSYNSLSQLLRIAYGQAGDTRQFGYNDLHRHTSDTVQTNGGAQVAQITQWMKNAVTLDWDSVNANRPAWNARWNKTIER